MSTLSRRSLLASGAVALAGQNLMAQQGASPAALVPAASPATSPANRPFKNPIVYRFTVGDIEAFSISDGTLRFPSSQKIMFPETQRGAMDAALVEEGEPTDHIPCYINTLVLRWEKETVIIDPGFGPGRRPRFGWVFDALPELGIRGDKVTAGFLSHAHIDHIGGFVNGNKPTFPNAAFHVLQSELDFWFAREPDFSQSKRDKNGLPGMIKENREMFEVLKPQTQALKGGEALLGGRLTVEAAPGHTAGHAVFRIQSKGETLLHIADLVHHPILMFRDPSWYVGLDHHPEAAVASRKQIFARAAAEHTRLFGFHLSWPGLGRVAKLGDGYRWLPERVMW